jgi:hypothetical protein
MRIRELQLREKKASPLGLHLNGSTREAREPSLCLRIKAAGIACGSGRKAHALAERINQKEEKAVKVR